jgi:hypothetical protein
MNSINTVVLLPLCCTPSTMRFQGPIRYKELTSEADLEAGNFLEMPGYPLKMEFTSFPSLIAYPLRISFTLLCLTAFGHKDLSIVLDSVINRPSEWESKKAQLNDRITNVTILVMCHCYILITNLLKDLLGWLASQRYCRIYDDATTINKFA